VYSEVEGRLERVVAEVGDRVNEGAALAVIDSRSLARSHAVALAAADKATAEARRTEQELALARESRLRLEALGQIAPQEELSRIRYAEEIRRAEREAAWAGARQKRAEAQAVALLLSDTRIRAPFDCVVVERFVSSGASVRRNTALFVVNGVGAPTIRFAVPPEAGARIAPGTLIRAEVETLSASLHARVTSVSPEVDSSSQLLHAEAGLLPGQSAKIATGLVVRVSLDRAGGMDEPRSPTALRSHVR
jgi:multidrug efflux pump subunit AcrA (membrane-fusion protein)